MKKYDVVGIGNAVVDIISPCDDVFLEKMGIEKGIMQLIEKAALNCCIIPWMSEQRQLVVP